MRSNRTFMELKYLKRKRNAPELIGSNRTFMELKSGQMVNTNKRFSVLIAPLWN